MIVVLWQVIRRMERSTQSGHLEITKIHRSCSQSIRSWSRNFNDQSRSCAWLVVVLVRKRAVTVIWCTPRSTAMNSMQCSCPNFFSNVLVSFHARISNWMYIICFQTSAAWTSSELPVFSIYLIVFVSLFLFFWFFIRRNSPKSKYLFFHSMVLTAKPTRTTFQTKRYISNRRPASFTIKRKGSSLTTRASKKSSGDYSRPMQHATWCPVVEWSFGISTVVYHRQSTASSVLSNTVWQFSKTMPGRMLEVLSHRRSRRRN